MRGRHALAVLGLLVIGVVGVASPAQAASGPWLVASAGNGHTCAINTARSLYCWGYNGSGKIGNAGVWASVTGGEGHTCAISTGKSLYCWGDNEFGAVGDGSTIQRLSPRKIA